MEKATTVNGIYGVNLENLICFQDEDVFTTTMINLLLGQRGDLQRGMDPMVEDMMMSCLGIIGLAKTCRHQELPMVGILMIVFGPTHRMEERRVRL